MRNRNQDTALPRAVYSFFATSDFERGLKQLKKTHQIEAINALEDTIIKLSDNAALDEGPGDSQVKGKVEELELDSGNCHLLYGIVPGTKIVSVDIKFGQ